MTYRYKIDQQDQHLIYKARCAVRGNLMQPGTHYDSDNTTTCMAEKTTMRLLLAMAASQNWACEHFDIFRLLPRKIPPNLFCLHQVTPTLRWLS